MALPALYRLRKKKDIETVFSKGATIKGRLLFVKYVSNILSHPRIAVVISKKISTKAVIRNLIRRRIHSAIIQSDELQQKHFFSTPIDIIITVLPIIVDKEFHEIKIDIDQILKKIPVHT